MAKQFEEIDDTLKAFIQSQNIFFVATADVDGKVNLSPKGGDSLRVLEPNRVIWLNLTGSGNETAAHILNKNRITIMLCAFDGKPLILRLYGTAKIYYEQDKEWAELINHFPDYSGKRQIFDVTVELVQTSCGYAVPNYEFLSERNELDNWAVKQGPEKIKKYWEDNNRFSVDGKPTGIPTND